MPGSFQSLFKDYSENNLKNSHDNISDARVCMILGLLAWIS
jgi:hypothetical protein